MRDGCANPTLAKGLCSRHYQEQRRLHGQPCAFDACGGRATALGLCPGHYEQKRKGKMLTPLALPVIVQPGDRFGLWVVLAEVFQDQQRTVLVRCVCGVEKTAPVYVLTSGASAGCHECRAPRGADVPHWTGAGEMPGRYWGRVIRGALVRGLDVLVTKEEAWSLFKQQGGRCALSGAPIGFREGTASLDRIDSTRFYEKGNLQWVHKVINRMKGSLTDDDFKRWCRLVATSDPHP